VKAISLYLFYSGFPFFSFSQYILNGSATKDNCNCYTLTKEQNFESGSVWNSNKINLTQPFDFWFNVYLGCKDGDGADGMVFILQTVASSVGTAGEGMGFAGVVPSIGIALDTWQNTNLNDPAYDHISIQANGNISHTADLAGPVEASATSTNIEDCQWHVVRIAWDPATQFLRSWFDGILRAEAQVDLVSGIFNNNPDVYWGFSAATGGANNLQRFCTALNPGFITNLPNNISCQPELVTFQNQSQSFGPIQSYWWDFGDGSTSTQQNPPPKLYTQPGVYDVKLVITGLDGCTSDTLRKTVVIGTRPVANFNISDTCAKQPPLITDLSTNQVGAINKWSWFLNGTLASGAQQPLFPDLPAGSYQVKLVTESVYGCVSDTVTKNFSLRNIPVLDVQINGGCVEEPVFFSARQTDTTTTINHWNWSFGNGNSSSIQNPVSVYNLPGTFLVNTWAVATNGCSSDTTRNTITIEKAIAFAGNDTLIVRDIPLQLNGLGGVNYSWTPPAGLNDNTIPNPVAVLQNDISYVLTVETAQGCIDTDTINIKVFKESAIYVPTGFTPNNDGLNDRLKPTYIWIKQLDYFIVYNRWGQKVFETRDMNQGWDGKINGVVQATGTFAWMVKGTDFAGKRYELRGTTTLIR